MANDNQCRLYLLFFIILSVILALIAGFLWTEREVALEIAINQALPLIN
jgi:hypothetical protein